MEGVDQSSSSALLVVLTFGLALFFTTLAFLIYRTGQATPAYRRLCRWLSTISLVGGTLLLLFCLLELTARIMIPGGYLKRRPHRGSDPGAIIETLPDGRAYWEFQGDWGFDQDGLRETPTVAEPAWRLGVIGDSVTYAVGVPAEKRFIYLLTQSLEKRCGPIQLIDASVPGYSLLQERLATERKVLPRDPDLLFVGVYSNDTVQFTVIGSTAYDVRVNLERGFPVFSFLPLPDVVNALLLQHSVFYQWMTLRGMAASDRVSGRVKDLTQMALDDLEQMRRGCVEQGCRIVVALFPELDAPLAEPESRGTARFYEPLRAWAAAAGVPLIDVRQMLALEDYLKIRRDECCHYNQEGHMRVAAGLEKELERLELLPPICR